MEILYGKEALESVADTYRQLYIDPRQDNARDLYDLVVKKGMDPDKRDLSHFICSPEDSNELIETPAGEVRAITLHERSDFEMFYNIVGNRCQVKELPASMGAVILDGVINWRKLDAHREDFAIFTLDKRNYLDALIVLSFGPYSNIPASKAGFSEEEWLSHSHTIRLYHECTHFICRRLYKEKIDPIWDELVADAVGIFAAFGKPDMDLECLFLGISPDGYTGGRLENYIDRKDFSSEEEYREKLDTLSAFLCQKLSEFEKAIKESGKTEAFEVVKVLEEMKE